MGVEQHHAVIAVGWDEDKIKVVEDWINTQPPNYKRLFVIGEVVCNGFRSIVMMPDGSKNGWAMSSECDELRKEFKERCKGFRVVEVTFGELGDSIVEES